MSPRAEKHVLFFDIFFNQSRRKLKIFRQKNRIKIAHSVLSRSEEIVERHAPGARCFFFSLCNYEAMDTVRATTTKTAMRRSDKAPFTR
jgi:mRNA deadenylase 3'-5' endonuclease subunit Ccr4